MAQLQADLYAEVEASDAERPRDREDMEAPDGLTIVDFDDGEVILPALEAEEVAAVRSDFFQGIAEPSSSPLTASAGGHSSPEVRLVEHFVRRVDARGTDVRLEIGQVFRGKPQTCVGFESTAASGSTSLPRRSSPSCTSMC